MANYTQPQPVWVSSIEPHTTVESRLLSWKKVTTYRLKIEFEYRGTTDPVFPNKSNIIIRYAQGLTYSVIYEFKDNWLGSGYNRASNFQQQMLSRIQSNNR